MYFIVRNICISLLCSD